MFWENGTILDSLRFVFLTVIPLRLPVIEEARLEDYSCKKYVWAKKMV